ncbi:uncharacterized protein LOC120328901 isoform X1 [Styela clava]
MNLAEIILFILAIVIGKTVATNASSVETISTQVSNNFPQAESKFRRWFCYNSPVPSDKYLRKCCENELYRYKDNWFAGGYYLTTILDRLQRWNCSEFREECTEPTWPFTDFTWLVYDRFCNRKNMEARCLSKVKKMVQDYGFIKSHKKNITENEWATLVESLVSKKMKLDDLAKPCIQIALFDRKDGGVGRFHEVVEVYVPFCGLHWDGYDYHTAMNRNVSPWTSMSSWCRGSVIVVMAVICVLGVATIIANITILSVFGLTPSLRNSQTVYKISLAIADLSVGLLVWPNMLVLQYLTFIQPRTMGDEVTHPSTVSNNTWLAHFPFGNESLVHRYPGGVKAKIIPRPYITFVGVCMSLSLTVSIYTLMIASFDRFYAIFKPLKYNKHSAQRYATYTCVALWCLSIFFALLPTFVRIIQYDLISSTFIFPNGITALGLLFVALFLPLIITWVVSYATFEMSKKHARNRQKMFSSGSSSIYAIEQRVARTLGIMVGVFTVCILPSVTTIVAGFFLPQTVWGDPNNIDVYTSNVYVSSEYVAVILLTSNSLWNFFIYNMRTSGFKEATRKLYTDALQKSRLSYVGRKTMIFFRGASGITISSMYTLKTLSGASETDLRKPSAPTNKTKLDDKTEDFTNKITETKNFTCATVDYPDSYLKNGTEPNKQSIVTELKVDELKKISGQDNKGFVNGDSTFDSFTVDFGTDRFLHSVMENINEDVEEDSIQIKKL